MLLLDTIPPVPYQNPWDDILSLRMRTLTAKKKRVAYFYEHPDGTTFRYRVYNMTQVLNETPGNISASFFFMGDLHKLNEIADAADILVICRARYDIRINHLITAFKRRGKRVLFDIDDLIFNVDWLLLILSTLDAPLYDSAANDFWFSYASRLGATLKQCDGAITTNAFLAEQIRNFANIPVSVVPNFLNRQQLEISERIFSIKKNLKPFSNDTLCLGYFSGTPSHTKDFNIIVPALEQLLEEMPFLCIVIAGYLQTDHLRNRFGDERIKYFPFCDFVNLQRLIGAVEFNVAPLQNNIFTDCKSDLKYFEAAIVGTPTIASPSYTFAQAIQDLDNGYLAQAHQWYSTIKNAINETKNYEKMALRAHDHALAHYAWFHQRNAIVSALGL